MSTGARCGKHSTSKSLLPVLAHGRRFGENGGPASAINPLTVVYATEFWPPMFTEQIEVKKQELTDKYVVVDATRPELARFSDIVGRVKTINMSGRALVEFDDYHQNIGWFDIDPAFLKVVDKPAPKPKEAPAKKPAAEPAATAAAKPAAPKPGGKLSTADILAAARGATAPAAKPQAAAAPVEEAPPVPEPTAQPEPAAKAPSEKVDRSKMSTADILAWCRAHDAKK